MNILAIIPARGGSKGIPRKNILNLCGKPLIGYSIDAALKSKLVNKVIVSTDDEEIADCSKSLGAEVPFLRPKEFAEDDTPMIDVILHALCWLQTNQSYTADAVVLMQPTSPLRTAFHVDEAIKKLFETGASSVVSVTEVPHQFNPVSVMTLKEDVLVPYISSSNSPLRRQDKPLVYARNGPAVLAVRYEVLVESKSLYGNNIHPYIMETKDSIDIDTFFDMEVAGYILSERSK